MQFISVEEFLEQDKEVQKVFIDWWEPSIGDLATNKHGNLSVLKENRDIEAVKIYKGQPYAIPLFTEGQLREFIEDKTNSKIDMMFFKKGYDIELFSMGKLQDEFEAISAEYEFEELPCELLQAYWKVALEIAKESVKNEYK